MSDIFKGWLTPLQAAKLVGKSNQTIYHHLRNGNIKSRKFDGRWLVNEASLLEFFKRK